jgi:prepilin-type N-terminal cleavage/methylation domain-containing protein
MFPLITSHQQAATNRRQFGISLFQCLPSAPPHADSVRHGGLRLSVSAVRPPTSGLRSPISSSPLHAPCSMLRKSPAFTLIELLIVIAIIAILAGLAFPAVSGAIGSSRKTQARNDVAQLAAAVKAFQLEYGRLPVSGASTSDNLDTPNANVISALTASNQLNPRGIVFFEPKQAKGGKGGLDGGDYKDPWGTAYKFMLDTSYDNRINVGGQTSFTTVIVESGGPDGNLAATNDNISNLK